MIVFCDDRGDPERDPLSTRNQAQRPVLPAAAANGAAEAVLAGRFDVDEASFIFGVPVQTIELWLRARRAAGLTSRMATAGG